jgi:tetratricopeptide (TPR) repeat protein
MTPAARKHSLGARLAAGGLLIAISLTGLVWTWRVARVDYYFNILPPVTKEEDDDVEFLSRYAVTLDRLIRADPTNGVIRKRYATILAKSKEYRRAQEQLQAALNTNSTPDSLFFEGDMYDKLGKQEEAVAKMADAVVLNPTDPQYNDAYLRLMNRKLLRVHAKLTEQKKQPANDPEYMAVKEEFAVASRNWAIRAPHDKNAYLFLGNHYIGPPLFPLQAYRCFLVGLSQAPWLTLAPDFMIEPRAVFVTIDQIHDGLWAKPYRGLTFGRQAVQRQGTTREQ